MIVRSRSLWTNALIAVSVLFLGLFGSSALAQLPVTGDTFTFQFSPSSNFGSFPFLIVQPYTNSYVQFDLSSLPAGSTVQKATLVLFVVSDSGPGQVDAYTVNSPWKESTLTGATAPLLGASASGGNPVSISGAATNDFVSIDVTAAAQQWVNGTVPNNGLALELVSASGAYGFDSKESTTTSHAPQLLVQLAGTPGPQGIQGPQGPAGPSGVATITLGSICSALQATATPAALLSLGCTVPALPVGGTVTGLTSGSLVLTINGGSPLTISSSGAFSFGTQPTGSAYTVAIQTQPTGGSCTLTGATGTVSAASASAISVSCSYQPVAFSGFQGVGGLASDGTNLWVSTTSTTQTVVVEKIDPNSGNVLAMVTIGYGIGSVAFDGTNIWVAGTTAPYSSSGNVGQVTLINPTTNSIVGNYLVGTHPGALKWDGTTMWVLGGDGNLYGLNKAGTIIDTTNIVYGTTAGTASNAGYGSLFADSNSNIYYLNYLYPSGGASITKFSSGQENGLYSFSQIYSATDDGTNIWVTNSNGLTKLVPSGGNPQTTYPIQGSTITFDGTNLWTYHSNVVEVINTSGVQIDSISGSAISYPGNILYDGKYSVWVINSNGTIARMPAQ